MESVVIAYSGGLDSTFLLKAAASVLGNKVLAVTAVSPTYPGEELAVACKMANKMGVKHKVIKTNELKNRRFSANNADRCYFCKKELFGKLTGIARREKLAFVLDAGNISDKRDFRPGSSAGREMGVRSPLKEAGFTKTDIRRLSKELGLPTWDKPAEACLASRIPYGTAISKETLSRIHSAERILRGLKFRQVRLRHYNGLCRIEVPRRDIPELIKKRNLIVERFKELGYNYITVDLEGYRTGSMNEVLK